MLKIGQTKGVDITADVDLAASQKIVHAFLADLAHYPEWLSIVPKAISDGDDCWQVELRAKVGPLARSKQLRMKKVVDTDTHIRFEREELDGRSHSAWVLDVSLSEPNPTTVRVEMRLHYSGSFAGGIVERLLAQEIENSKTRLRQKVEVAS